MERRAIRQLQAICPGCKRMRFIPLATVPYCTPSCKRNAEKSKS